jgi:hypothetical protein
MYTDAIGRLTHHIEGGTSGLLVNPLGVAPEPLLFEAANKTKLSKSLEVPPSNLPALLMCNLGCIQTQLDA